MRLAEETFTRSLEADSKRHKARKSDEHLYPTRSYDNLQDQLPFADRIPGSRLSPRFGLATAATSATSTCGSPKLPHILLRKRRSSPPLGASLKSGPKFILHLRNGRRISLGLALMLGFDRYITSFEAALASHFWRQNEWVFQRPSPLSVRGLKPGCNVVGQA